MAPTPSETARGSRHANLHPEHAAREYEALNPKSAERTLPDEFYDYLVDSGYTEYTKSGNPGTVYSYKNAVSKVCAWEGCGWAELAGRIDKAIRDYSPGGMKAKLGGKSHNTVINGLRAYGRFCAVRKYRR